jgi:hypothetical protein
MVKMSSIRENKEEANKFIDAWLVESTACDIRKCDISAVFEALETRLYDAWEHNREIERQALLKLRDVLLTYQESLLQERELELSRLPVTETDADIKSFRALSQAIDFIAELIERNAASELMAQFAYIQHPQVAGPHYSTSFTNHIFPQLQTYHHEINFRARYEGKRFPADETRYTLGGHMKELGCIHIDFIKKEQGWVLDSIWECR